MLLWVMVCLAHKINDRLDLGGLELGYSPSNHTGLRYVELSIIGSDGRFRR